MKAAEVIEIKSHIHISAPETAGVKAQAVFEEMLSASAPEPVMQVVHLLLCLQILNLEEQEQGLTAKGKRHMRNTLAALGEAIDELDKAKHAKR